MMSWVERVMVGVFMLAVVARLVGRHLERQAPPQRPSWHPSSGKLRPAYAPVTCSECAWTERAYGYEHAMRLMIEHGQLHDSDPVAEAEQITKEDR